MAKKKELTYKSWDEVEKAIENMAYNNVLLAKAKAQHDKQILDMTAIYNEKIKDTVEEIKQAAADVRAYTKANIKDFGDKRTRKFACGTIKLTASTSVVIPKGQEEYIIKNLKGKNMLDCIGVVESINKDILKTYGGDTIASVGAKLKSSTACKITTIDEEGTEIEC